MNIIKSIIVTLVLLVKCLRIDGSNIVCFLDSSNPSLIAVEALTVALHDCTHFIYGYATLTPRYFSLSFDGSVGRTLALADIAGLKEQFPKVKFLLSLGGNRDLVDNQKYMQLLDAKEAEQQNFIQSVLKVLNFYKFDGLDLAYQFPNEIASKAPEDDAVGFWRGVRNLFGGKSEEKPKARQYKMEFSKLVESLSSHLKSEKRLLTLSVLPHVNPDSYFDIPTLNKHLDFVHLWSFDYVTPLRSPHRADYPAPLFAPTSKGNSLPHSNVDSQVRYWLAHNVSSEKLILGIPSFGRTWKLTKLPNHGRAPLVENVNGPSEVGDESQTPGVLNWLEICGMLTNYSIQTKGSYDQGHYLMYPSSDIYSQDTWIGFDGPNIAHYKSLYASAEKLGGVAEIDLSFDDYGGNCTGLKFPILKYMKGMLKKVENIVEDFEMPSN
uniref:GH18 domain-containing protein n=1 Tax=Stomoxys calcitrans TaxID=35570 RepID=A0A1I8PU28_STOCA